MNPHYQLLLLFVVGVLVSSQLPPWGVGVTVFLFSGAALYVIQRIDTRLQEENWSFLLDSLPPSMTVGVHSIEELRQRALEIWTEREQMDLVLSEIREGVLAISPSDEVLLANEQAKDFLNLKSDVVGEEISKKQFPKPVRNVLRSALKQEVSEQVWKEGVKPERRYYELLGFPMKDRLGALLMIRDVTKLRRLERIRKDFIANISHELRTPVTIILMNIETLIDDPEMPIPQQKRFLDAIRRNSTRLSRLLNDLLDLSRIEAGQYELNSRQQSILPVVEQVCQSLEERCIAKQQKLSFSISADMQAFCDEQALEHILTNLVENASKYTPEKTVISIRASVQNAFMRIEVEDNGPGIAAKHQPRLFERFYRVDKGRSRDAGGTGLGLAIVRHLTETMGGRVGMKDAPTGGALFWVEIPVLRPADDLLLGE